MAILNFPYVAHSMLTYHSCENDVTNFFQKVTSWPKIMCHRPCTAWKRFSDDCFEYLNTWSKHIKKIVRYVISRFFAICHFVKSRKHGKIVKRLTRFVPKETEINYIYIICRNRKLYSELTTDVFWSKHHFWLSKSIIWGPFLVVRCQSKTESQR